MCQLKQQQKIFSFHIYVEKDKASLLCILTPYTSLHCKALRAFRDLQQQQQHHHHLPKVKKLTLMTMTLQKATKMPK